MAGTVFVVATPIGNLDDISFRALRVLGAVDLICAEDTRVTRKLLSRYEIHTPLTSFHQRTSEAKLASILDRVTAGDSIAVVSDAGTPGISDPGHDLCRMAAERGLVIAPIPGPSAAVTGLMASGLPSGRFSFVGFPPRNKSDRARFFESVGGLCDTVVLYEAPSRLLATLRDLLGTLGDCPACAARELTKMHEEIVRGPLTALIERFEAAAPRGEFTLVVTPMPRPVGVPEHDRVTCERLAEEQAAAGVPTAQAARSIAAATGVRRSDAYSAVLEAAARLALERRSHD